jgi:hypothetical protein
MTSQLNINININNDNYIIDIINHLTVRDSEREEFERFQFMSESKIYPLVCSCSEEDETEIVREDRSSVSYCPICEYDN